MTRRQTGWWRRIAVLIGIISLQSGHVLAQEGLKLQLVPETRAIVPGQRFRVGLYLQHAAGWHTYWRQPGIVGVPTTVSWDLPPGFVAGDLEYPEPETTMMFQIKAQGYERDVLLQTEICAPASLEPHQSITLKAKAAWMCCGKTCHPGSKELSLVMPVSKQTEDDLVWAPLFARERATFPRASPAWMAEAEEQKLNVTLRLKPLGNQARRFSPGAPLDIIFFTEDGWINSDQDQKVEVSSDGTLIIQLIRAEVFLGKTQPDKLYGIVQRSGGWHADGSLRSMVVQPLLRR